MSLTVGSAITNAAPVDAKGSRAPIRRASTMVAKPSASHSLRSTRGTSVSDRIGNIAHARKTSPPASMFW
jgi:hypothetical protein